MLDVKIIMGTGRKQKQQKREPKNKVVGAINAPVSGSHLL
jgi:hypothetical protein